LRDQHLADRPRLAEGLKVEAGWELAVETVLGADLQAVLVDDFNDLDLSGFVQGDLRLLSPRRWRAGAGQFARQGRGAIDLSPWLGQVKPVDSLEQALALRQLTVGQSLISRDGYWVGRHFLRVRRASEAESGMLARGQEIDTGPGAKSAKRRSRPWKPNCKTCGRSSVSRKTDANTCAVCCKTRPVNKAN
jgi:chromosome segregation protein